MATGLGRLQLGEGRGNAFGKRRPAPIDALSPRQRQVLESLARGKTTKEIGYALGIRERTVTWHISQVVRILGANSRAEAIAIAFERGLLHDVHAAERDDGPDREGGPIAVV